MSKALSMDLRERVLGAIAAGASCREAAARFGVSAASAIRWRQRQEAQGSARPGPLGGDRRSQHMEGHAETILGLLKDRPDATLAELQAALAERGVAASSSGLWRFFQRRRITLKKSRPMRTSRTAPTS
jgi:transposase